MAQMRIEQQSLTNIADAIRAKTGSTDALTLAQMPEEIAGIKSGAAERVEAPWKAVNFIDYDGFNCYSYTVAEAQALTELPPNPTHDGLVAQGWNWTLEEIKAVDAPCTVGQMVATDDGATRINIEVTTLAAPTFMVGFQQTIANDVQIDWGDGSPVETVASTAFTRVSHDYTALGNYTVSLKEQSGKYELSNTMLDNIQNASIAMKVLSANIGNGVTGMTNTFRSCNNIRAFSHPNTSINKSGNWCPSLKLRAIVLPRAKTTTSYLLLNYNANTSRISFAGNTVSLNYGSAANNNCNSYICIPPKVTDVGRNAFNAAVIVFAIVPASATQIGNGAFTSCTWLKKMWCRATTPPTLATTTVIVSTIEAIYVPDAAVDEYKAATNWAAVADKIYPESEMPKYYD